MTYLELIGLSFIVGTLIMLIIENSAKENRIEMTATEKITVIFIITLIVFIASMAAIGIMESQEETRNTRNEFCENWIYKNGDYYCLQENGIAQEFLCEQTKCYYINGSELND